MGSLFWHTVLIPAQRQTYYFMYYFEISQEQLYLNYLPYSYIPILCTILLVLLPLYFGLPKLYYYFFASALPNNNVHISFRIYLLEKMGWQQHLVWTVISVWSSLWWLTVFNIRPCQGCLCHVVPNFSCPPPPNCCESGVYAYDECGCCLTCAKLELQPCGSIGGQCAKGLQCLKTCGMYIYI